MFEKSDNRVVPKLQFDGEGQFIFYHSLFLRHCYISRICQCEYNISDCCMQSMEKLGNLGNSRTTQVRSSLSYCHEPSEPQVASAESVITGKL